MNFNPTKTNDSKAEFASSISNIKDFLIHIIGADAEHPFIVTEAEATANLAYEKADKSVVSKNGLIVKIKRDDTEFTLGLYLWDLAIMSYLHYTDDNKIETRTPTGIIHNCVMRNASKGAEDFLKDVAESIKGKKVKPIVFRSKSVKGVPYDNAIFAVID